MPGPLPLPANEPRKPRNELSEDARRHDVDKATFDSWITECEAIQEAVVEGLLSNLPSAKDG